jgi:hypothetical protein
LQQIAKGQGELSLSLFEGVQGLIKEETKSLKSEFEAKLAEVPRNEGGASLDQVKELILSAVQEQKAET